MAIISSYPKDTRLQPEDSWVGTDVKSRKTRKYTVGALADYLNSSGSLVVSGQMTYTYKSFPNVDPGTVRKTSADTSLDIAWDSFTELEISKFDKSQADVSPYFEYLVEEQIIFYANDDGGQFGHYRILDYQPSSTPDFYTIELEHIGSSGTFVLDNTYNVTKFALDRNNDITDKKYVHDQGIPSQVWTINHGLNKYPSVTAVDTASSVVFGQVDYVDKNNLTITFNASFSGEAYLN